MEESQRKLDANKDILGKLGTDRQQLDAHLKWDALGNIFTEVKIDSITK